MIPVDIISCLLLVLSRIVLMVLYAFLCIWFTVPVNKYWFYLTANIAGASILAPSCLRFMLLPTVMLYLLSLYVGSLS